MGLAVLIVGVIMCVSFFGLVSYISKHPGATKDAFRKDRDENEPRNPEEIIMWMLVVFTCVMAWLFVMFMIGFMATLK